MNAIHQIVLKKFLLLLPLLYNNYTEKSIAYQRDNMVLLLKKCVFWDPEREVQCS